jgi:uncharacterized SAM-binding protein YcdF (DUF218 family)
MTSQGDIRQNPIAPAPAESAGPRPESRRAHLRTAVARGVALFIGLFTLLNLLIGLRHPGYDANLWWIDLFPLQNYLPLIAETALLFVAIMWLSYAFAPIMSDWRRRAVRLSIELLMLFVVWNILSYYGLLLRGRFQTVFAVPFSIFVAVGLIAIWLGAGSERPKSGPLAWLVMLVTAAACAVVFPLLQMVCFGLTDYRRPADVVVVFGARAYADGHASDALADRVRLAVKLYDNNLRNHWPMKLILSGGPADGGLASETDTMRRMAMDLGVSPDDIITDPLGVNTDATVRNVEPVLARLAVEQQEAAAVQGALKRPLLILAVSHFYHLPRIRMRFKVADRDVWTVPVRQPLAGMPRFMLREVAALWRYYFEALTKL